MSCLQAAHTSFLDLSSQSGMSYQQVLPGLEVAVHRGRGGLGVAGWMEQGAVDHTHDGPLYALSSALHILGVGPPTTTL